MKIAIMGAMPEEIAPILEKVGSYKTVEYAGNRYYEATYRGVRLVIAYSKIGKVFSTLTATTMIEHFGATKLLFSGVAGAISPTLKVGDLIVAIKLAQHDLDITAFGHPYGYVPEGAVFVETDKEMIEISKEVAASMGKSVQEGIIATGDQFVADEKRKNWIGTTFGADALEMEGGSVAVVCDALNIPFFILRSISDAADMDASFSFDTFLETSAKESAEFVMKMVDRIVE
ncbi:5'-methylthioadenosine/adenosylhomocysteine nucleosidase [Sulfurimonas sp. CVO]|jgi:adenosylhomocysteine/aminodeoxyfutalosine nucleosidase|uniref:5'-methylthioadenosine/adenosylhomocysteine nucleosidase n=1 Tax=Sulfurimonas sp. CVO TaxID=2283483 RepID=UPI00132EE92B|nr:5'-methylthioadenosine/adenosylhomocysteine nucleosidase [Sulfurimonas sp. CVO]QHG90868.1 5'-methylthioadenosine/adenosylhomocysteine nucleosidase [Sulfurimonas sp. CVO]